jgi:glycosyltransferase involved in cell wall biosynthesis
MGGADVRGVPVSVVIPAYNCGQWVAQAVDSVLAQTAAPAEVLVVDDGSTDDTGGCLAPYRGRVRYLFQENRGVSAARNAGVAASGEALVAFLDADDVWHPRKLELQLAVLGREPEIALMGARAFDWPAAEFPLLEEGHPGGRVRAVPWDRLAVRNYFVTSSVVARRAALDRAGPFDTCLQGPEDWDLWLRVAESGRTANLDLPLVGYRPVAGSVSRQAETCRAGMLRILHKFDERGSWGRRRALRRKAYGYTYHACSYVYGAAGLYGAAVGASLRSFLWYPLPLRRDEVRTPLERPKRLAVHLLRGLRLMAREAAPPSSTADGRPDALGQRTGTRRAPAAGPGLVAGPAGWGE